MDGAAVCHEENRLKASVLFRSSRRRHPLARAALAVLAVVLLGFASVFVMLVAAGVLAAWLLRRGWQRLRGRTSPRPAGHGEVLEAEYRVVSRDSARLASR
jgi:membrane protein implicated in regulation of membrane protease activity